MPKIQWTGIESGNEAGRGERIHHQHVRTRRKQCSDAILSGQPIILGASGFALPTAIQGQTDRIIDPAGNYWDMFQTTAQTLMPAENALGVEVALDQVDNESVEYVLGGNLARNPYGFTVGTNSFLWRCKFAITDADGSDQFGIFIRKQEAFAVPTSFLTTGDPIYTDIVLFGFAATVANPNPVNVSYDQNNSGSSTVQAAGFTWADTLVHQLEIRVIRSKVQFLINGVALGGSVSKDGDGAAITAQATLTGPSITLDTSDFMIPGIFCRQDAALTPIYLRSYACGTLEDFGIQY